MPRTSPRTRTATVAGVVPARAPVLSSVTRAAFLGLGVIAAGGLLISAVVPSLNPGAAFGSIARVRVAAAPAAYSIGDHYFVPRILSAIDATLYRKAFQLYDKGRHKQARALLTQITDKSLAGLLTPQRKTTVDLGNYKATRSERRALTRAPAAATQRPAQRLSKRVREPKESAAARLFYKGKNRAALTLAKVAPMSPASNWTAGLAAWRLNKFAAAERYFATVARARKLSDWSRAAGAYWASRASLRDRQPERVDRFLAMAARYPRTFYGLLATRALGRRPDFNWKIPKLTTAVLDHLKALPAGRRALALIQIGETTRAKDALRRLARGANRTLTEMILAVASRANMPNLLYEMGNRLRDTDGRPFDSALFPLPEWQPAGGYSVDRALIFGIMRQESQFNPAARSPAGARGLMQIMPPTASFISGDRSFKAAGKSQLYDPRLNLSLAQKYVGDLLDEKPVHGNLVLLAAAYNGGIGNLVRWRRRINSERDPLLFLESIPIRETRQYVERVMANLWMYRLRLGQPTPSLDALAAGRMPVYRALDVRRVAMRGGFR